MECSDICGRWAFFLDITVSTHYHNAQNIHHLYNRYQLIGRLPRDMLRATRAEWHSFGQSQEARVSNNWQRLTLLRGGPNLGPLVTPPLHLRLKSQVRSDYAMESPYIVDCVIYKVSDTV